MSEKILTLFGEELFPEPAKTPAKGRAVKNKDEKNEPDKPAESPALIPDAAIANVSLFETGNAVLPGEKSVEEVILIAENVVEEPAETAGKLTETSVTEASLTNQDVVAEINVPAEATIITELITEENQDNTKVPELDDHLPDTALEIASPGENVTSAKDFSTHDEEEHSVETEQTGNSNITESGSDEAIPAEGNQPGGENLPEDWKGEKQYYTIGEVAALFKVNTSHIRFWTNEFKIKVRTTRKGDRLYTPAHIAELRNIYNLVKERGYTLSGAKTKLKSQKKIDITSIDLKQSLLLLKNQLIQIRNQL